MPRQSHRRPKLGRPQTSAKSFSRLRERLYQENPGMKERVEAQVKQWLLEIEQKERRRKGGKDRAKS